MKRQVSPVAAVLIVVLTFGVVMGSYWKGLLGEKKREEGKPMMGGGPMPPPPLRGLANFTVRTLAGPLPQTPEAGDGGFADGVGEAARFDGPSAVAVGPDGRIYVTDSRNHRIRVVTPAGAVTTLAGSGPPTSLTGAFADGPALQARFWNPSGIAADRTGTVYIADTGNHRIRVIRDGAVTTLAGGETPIDRFGLPDGGFADGPGSKARFRYPSGICLSPEGSLLVADTGNKLLRRVLPDGTTDTVGDLGRKGAQSPCGVALGDGCVLVTDPATETVFRVNEDEVAPMSGIDKAAEFWFQPTGLWGVPGGVAYITDAGSHSLLRIVPGGAPELCVGVVARPQPGVGYADGPGDRGTFAGPSGVAVGPGGELYVTDFGNNCLRKIVVGLEIAPVPTPGGGKSG